MLQHNHDASEHISADPQQVSAKEIAQALAAIEESKARQSQQETPPQETFPLETIIAELNLSTTPDEVWQTVQQLRQRSQEQQAQQQKRRHRQRRRLLASAISSLCLWLVVGSFWRAQAISRHAQHAQGLLWAIHRDDLTGVQQWLAQGADPNAVTLAHASPPLWRTLINPMEGCLPALIVAANHAQPAMVETLLRSGGRANIQDEAGSTALHWLAGKRKFGIAERQTLQTLLAHGADMHLRNDRGMTALDYARVLGNEAFVQAYQQSMARP